MADFTRSRYFTTSEPWGDPARIAQKLLDGLEAFRELVDRPVHVNFGTQGQHVARWHTLGLAVDVTVESHPGDPLDLLLAAERICFDGIGVYPRARDSRLRKPLGFHFDFRGLEHLPDGAGRRWLAVPSDKGLITQYPLDTAHLRRFGLL